MQIKMSKMALYAALRSASDECSQLLIFRAVVF